MLSLNRAQIIGNLTRDPELKYTPNGQAVTSFSVATNRSWQNADGTRQDAVEYHDVVAWGKLGEIAAQVLSKGKQAFVEGRLQTRNWEAQDGAKRQKTEIVAENVIALGPRGEKEFSASASAPADAAPGSDEAKDSAKGGKKSPGKSEPKSEEINIDDIPF